MITLKLTRVVRRDKTSSKTGKPFTSVGIQCEEKPGAWINGFGNTANSTWKPGDTVEVEALEQIHGYWNFTMPKSERKATNVNESGVTKQLNQLDRIEKKLDTLIGILAPEHSPHVLGSMAPTEPEPPPPPPTLKEYDQTDVPF